MDTYKYLKDNIDWQEKDNHLIKILQFGDNKIIDDILETKIKSLNLFEKYEVMLIYFEYYKDGIQRNRDSMFNKYKGLIQVASYYKDEEGLIVRRVVIKGL